MRLAEIVKVHGIAHEHATLFDRQGLRRGLRLKEELACGPDNECEIFPAIIGCLVDVQNAQSDDQLLPVMDVKLHKRSARSLDSTTAARQHCRQSVSRSADEPPAKIAHALPRRRTYAPKPGQENTLR